jgi:hypothetical protein
VWEIPLVEAKDGLTIVFVWRKGSLDTELIIPRPRASFRGHDRYGSVSSWSALDLVRSPLELIVEELVLVVARLEPSARV